MILKPKHLKKIVIALILLPMLLSAADTVPKKINKLDQLPFSDVSKAISVYQKASQFSIKVASNPTTGYAWFLMDYDHALVEPMSRKYYPSTDGKIGAPGYEVWVFKVAPEAFVVPQLLKIDMQYTRPFQVSVVSNKTFSVVTAASKSIVDV